MPDRSQNEMPKVVSPGKIAATLSEHWLPRVVGEVDELYIKVAKIKGDLTWHAHEHEDEMFFVLKGRLRIETDQDTFELHEGDMFVVPKGVRHNPIAQDECHIMLIERKSTCHTGDVTMQKTRSIEQQLEQSGSDRFVKFPRST